MIFLLMKHIAQCLMCIKYDVRIADVAVQSVGTLAGL